MTQSYSPAPPQQYPYDAPKPPLNGMAIAGLVTALLGIPIVPVVLGHFAMAKISRTGERGATAAVIGLVLGYLLIAVYALAMISAFLGG